MDFAMPSMFALSFLARVLLVCFPGAVDAFSIVMTVTHEDACVKWIFTKTTYRTKGNPLTQYTLASICSYISPCNTTGDFSRQDVYRSHQAVNESAFQNHQKACDRTVHSGVTDLKVLHQQSTYLQPFLDNKYKPYAFNYTFVLYKYRQQVFPYFSCKTIYSLNGNVYKKMPAEDYKVVLNYKQCCFSVRTEFNRLKANDCSNISEICYNQKQISPIFGKACVCEEVYARCLDKTSTRSDEDITKLFKQDFVCKETDGLGLSFSLFELAKRRTVFALWSKTNNKNRTRFDLAEQVLNALRDMGRVLFEVVAENEKNSDVKKACGWILSENFTGRMETHIDEIERFISYLPVEIDGKPIYAPRKTNQRAASGPMITMLEKAIESIDRHIKDSAQGNSCSLKLNMMNRKPAEQIKTYLKHIKRYISDLLGVDNVYMSKYMNKKSITSQLKENIK